MLSILRVLSFFVVSLVSAAAFAQDSQSGVGQDVSKDSQTESGTERASGEQTVGISGGGFMGLGEKKLQLTKSIPLPTRNSSRPLFASAQSVGAREISPAYPTRRSKPNVGELSTDFPARMVYLNGKNISSVREQLLEGVRVRIDSNGNLHISAPHYEVQEFTHYRPLLPRDVPRLSKPAPQNDEALFERDKLYTKSPAGKDSSSMAEPGVVPPVDSGVDAQAPASEVPQKPGTSPTDKAAVEGQKL